MNLQVRFHCILLVLGIQTSAQQVASINDASYQLPEGTYLKDKDNEFDYFVGTWTATHNSRTIQVEFVKELHQPINYGKQFFTDMVVGRFVVKDNAGQILLSTLGKNFSSDIKHKIQGTTFFENGQLLALVYAGGNCSVGQGFIDITKVDATHFK